MRRNLALLLLPTFLACTGDGSAVTADAGTGSCSCSAVQVSFDKSSSMLGATNVQDALDELAARPVPEQPVGGRIKTVVRLFTNPGTMGGVVQTLACSDELHDVALGGACGTIEKATLVGTSITNDATHAEYSCAWSQPTGSSAAMAVTVVCLENAR